VQGTIPSQGAMNGVYSTQCVWNPWQGSIPSQGMSVRGNSFHNQVDQGRSKRKFVEGDQVFLILQPYRKNSLKDDHCQKLAPKFYGPCIVLKHVGQVAYQLAFPSHSKLHPVFHVSFLKKVVHYSRANRPRP
jgi:hypothetical protein